MRHNINEQGPQFTVDQDCCLVVGYKQASSIEKNFVNIIVVINVTSFRVRDLS